jgi:hypothetical protein
MDSMLSSYGIDAPAFTEMATYNGAIVAGSFALAGYLKQEGIDHNFEPNDMDIFLPGRQEPVCNDDATLVDPPTFRIRPLERVTAFLHTQGYTENNKFSKSVASEGYYKTINKLQRVVSFNNKSGKEIQVIVVNTHDMIGHMITDFDLSCCVTWWSSDMSGFHTYSCQTKEKKMFFMHEPHNAIAAAKMYERAKKYEARGFTLIDKPCPKHTRADKRQELDAAKFNGLAARDIFGTDNLPVRGWLAASDWNIILKLGEQFYAFNRKALMDSMAKCQTPVDGRIGVLYDTPMNQSITTTAYCSLRYADHSIYELTPAYSVKVGQKVKSLYTLTAYTVKQWANRADGKKMSPAPYRPVVILPGAQEIRQMLRSIAEIFSGIETEEVMTLYPDLIPAGCVGLFQTIMNEVSAARHTD